ncbi:hypothetical protein NVV27_01940 [Acinetobacter radioresistens]|uniref:hypothetical protein n=1 Tax=Acinetobacter radioresistens TaxID=40216 RepID=UPI002246F21E|nr:hypothetical protein [Acinetobacter radioresistens]MCX0344498.1 hypothetical protein [Acinetobacter radioresistens]
MEKDLKVKIIDVFGAVSSLAVIFFFFTLWLFSYNSIDQPLKEAWTSTISFLSVLATLAAAYIAAHLFNDWKDQHNQNLETTILLEFISKLDFFEEYVSSYQNLLISHSIKEMGNLDKQIRMIEPITLAATVHYYKKKFDGLNYNSKTLANKYYLLKKRDYGDGLKSIALLIKQSLNLQKSIISTEKVNNNSYSIELDSIQLSIDATIEILGQAKKTINELYTQAIVDIRAKN